ncbi:MAG: hypothetical protein BWY09_03071 [Candidatus Hydrogenedentes bacterium ADurb.Bin179]|nr:MAG: hypothetical protein BWY09_03071 [Candidatus Hydrogenedentes bacterium ADurb.Bin179]
MDARKIRGIHLRQMGHDGGGEIVLQSVLSENFEQSHCQEPGILHFPGAGRTFPKMVFELELFNAAQFAIQERLLQASYLNARCHYPDSCRSFLC